jgi:KipI family sensor histidine kinase inhibitor
MEAKYLVVGDRAVTIEFSRDIDPEANSYVHRMDLVLQKFPIQGIEEVLPTVRSLLVYYDPEKLTFGELKTQLKVREKQIPEIIIPPKKFLKIPCCYEGEYSPDLEYIASTNNLKPTEVIQIHSSTRYQVYCFGTAPGSPNMGINHPKISTPRRATPRASMPPGAVAIGGKQCVFYIVEIPGGHWMIGKTPIRLYNPLQPLKRLIELGDTVQFYPIEEQQFKEIAKKQNEFETVKNNLSVPSRKRSIPTLEISRAGLFTIVQDLGRYGYQKYGVALTGAVDSISLRAANLIIGNNDNDAALEITLLGPHIKVLTDTVVCVTGADLDFQVNRDSVGIGKAVPVRKGDLLSFGRPRSGCRSYLSVLGGIDVPKILGSRSTFLRARIGGIEGRLLQEGDVIFTRERSCNPTRDFCIKKPYIHIRSQKDDPIRVILGPQDDYFLKEAIKLFFNTTYTVLPQSNREACLLEGPRILHKGATDIISDGTPPGSVQILPNGYPLVFFRDRQIGGYPKVCVIITADLDRIAQLRPGNTVRFEAVSLEEAHKAYKELKSIWGK